MVPIGFNPAPNSARLVLLGCALFSQAALAAPPLPLGEDIPVAAMPAPASTPVAADTGGQPSNPVGQSIPVQPAEGEQVDLIVTARKSTPGDPLQRVNGKSYDATQAVDRAVVGPVAMTYQRKVPGPLRDGLRNVLKNLHEPDVFLNFLLQHKVGKAAETAGRFAINTTIGGAGLFDVAKRHPFNLPRRPNGLANTLGFYGVKPGPFFFLPLIGPTTLRDLIGNGVDGLLLPTIVGAPFKGVAYTLPTGVLRSLDHRVEFDAELTKQREASADPYVAARDYYLRRRQAEIDALRGMSAGPDPKKL